VGAAREAVLNLNQRLAEHYGRAGEIAVHLAAEVSSADRVERERYLRRLPATDPETLASLAVVLADRLARDELDPYPPRRLRALSRRPLPLDVVDIELLVERAAAVSSAGERQAVLSVVAVAADGLEAGERPATRGAIARAIELLAEPRTSASAVLRTRLIMALPSGSPVPSLQAVMGGDTWSALVADEIGRRCAASRPTAALVEIMAASGRRPGRSWVKRTRELILAAGRPGTDLVRLMLTALLDVPAPSPAPWWDILPERRLPNLGPANADLVRGALWVAALIDESGMPSLVATVFREAGHRVPSKVAYACLASLGGAGTPAAAAELAGLWWEETGSSWRERIGQALDTAARPTRTSRSALLEPFVPREGSRRIVRLERLRIETVLAESPDRSWDLATWTRRYVTHPVTGPLARNLVWSVEDASGLWTGVARHEREPGVFLRLDGSRASPMSGFGAVIRPWHPFFADPHEVVAWRRLLATHHLDQTVEQVDRPVFRRTIDEPLDATESFRYAEHDLDASVARRTLRARGWVWGGARPYRVWSPTGERAELAISIAESGGLRTGALRFSASFAELSPIFLSEVLLEVSRLVEQSRV
jgi:hypothetical protein